MADMLLGLELFFDGSKIILTFAAAILSYMIYKFNRIDKKWLFIIAGFFFIAMSSGMELFSDMGILPGDDRQVYMLNVIFDDGFLFMGRLFLIVGLWYMLRSFESFDVTEKRTREKIEAFSAALREGVKGGKRLDD